jgi:hypothetical protein
MEEDRFSWSCRLVNASEEGQSSARVSEGCQTFYSVQFKTCMIAVTRARCASGQCCGCCFGAENLAQRLVSGLKGPADGRIALGGVLGLVSQALDASLERPGLSVLVLLSVDTFSVASGLAFLSVSKGATAFFQFDSAQSMHLEVASSRKPPSSNTSPLSSSPVSPALSATNSSSSSPRLQASIAFECKYDFSLGSCRASQWFISVVDADSQRLSSTPSKPSAACSIWKRSQPPGGLSMLESIGAVTKVFLQEWEKGASERPESSTEALEASLLAGIKSKRGDVSVSVMVVPALAAEAVDLPMTLRGPVVEEEHSPLGVMVSFSPSKSLLSLLVRTVPFGSLSCSASENQVTLYLSRRQDEMGQSLTTKWTQNVKKWIDELHGEHFRREVLLPCKIVASSQRVALLDNGIVEITYEVREAQAAAPHRLSASNLGSGPEDLLSAPSATSTLQQQLPQQPQLQQQQQQQQQQQPSDFPESHGRKTGTFSRMFKKNEQNL